MAGEKTVKLFKIASEINIGRDTIVSYLQGKGFDIQNKPTTTLTEQMVELIHDKFKKEKKAADIQREKIQKHKDLRQETKKVEPLSEHTPIGAEKSSTHIEDDNLLNVTQTPNITHQDKNIAPAQDSYLNEIKQPVILGKIDISTISKPINKPNSEEVKVEKAEIVTPNKIEVKIEHTKVIQNVQEPEKVITNKEIETVVSKPEPIAHPENITPVAPNKPDEAIVIDRNKENLSISHHKMSESTKAKDDSQQHFTKHNKTIEGQKDVIKSGDKKVFRDERHPNTEKHWEKKKDYNKQGTEKKYRDDYKNSDKKPNEFGNKFKNDDKKKFDNTNFKQNPDQNKNEGQHKKFERNDKFDKFKKKKSNDNELGVAPQLRGLTVVGKIELAKAQQPASQTDRNKNQRDYKHDPNSKNKQFKKRKHTNDDTSTFSGSIKEQLDNKFKFRDKESTTFNKDAKDTKEKLVKETNDKADKKKKKKKTIRESISQDEVNRAIRETLAGMDLAGSSSRTKNKLKKKAEREEKELRLKEEKSREDKTLQLTEFVTTSDLANLMGISPSEIIMKCMQLGLMVTINQRLDKETIILISDDYGFEVDFLDEKESQFVEQDIDPEETLKPRSPIVTIMGHVDHGKTSLLDYIRNANVVAGEAGGITQHIGAYKVKLQNGKTITFLDTPGHEAFTAMRARGAQVTDIVILVVAADDSVMPQTIEAISHAKAANVPIVIAINKMDKPDANPDRIKQQLADQNVLVEEWGGKYQSVHISAKKGINIDELLDKILLEAEFLDLKANPDREARGIVIESNMKQGFGPVATIIVQKGTLSVGDPFVAGVSFGKVRALLDERERKLHSAKPGDPILVVGFDEVPEAGDSFVVASSDQEARQIAIERKQLRREQELRQVHHKTLDEISAQIQIGGVKELNLVIKGDVAGSVEALADSLYKLSRDEVKVNILHKGAGHITESDVMLAAASSAVVIGFNVNPTAKAKKIAENEKIDIRQYDIIYDCINEIQLALEGLLTPEYKEEIVATVEVRKVFKISKYGSIAGCYVLSGKISRNDKVRLMRDGFKEFEGTIASLKRSKDDVKEVDQGFECGIQLNGYNDINDGDIIEAFKNIEIKRKFV